MNDTPTPETDEATLTEQFLVRDLPLSVVAAASQRFERELNAALAENAAMREAIREAHKIIQVLYMDALDHHKESWPRANEWMGKHAAFAKP